VLINNAGLLTDHRQTSVDGFELTFAVNVLAPFLLTTRLLDTLKRNAPARVVNVASTAMGGGVIDFSNLQLERRFDGWQAYANSKLMNVLLSNHLAGQIAGSGVVSNALCPGLIDTNFFHTNTLFAGGAYERLRPGMRPPEEGALVPLYLATDPTAGMSNGEFYVRQGP
jgi:NAD(P)-dependent dehydrogenase (short-subunit alcohol dehydrogenase family)